MPGDRPKLLVVSGGASAVSDRPARAAAEAPSPPPASAGELRGRAAGVVGLAAALVAVAMVSGGGVSQAVPSAGNTWTEIALLLVGALAVGAGLLWRPAGERRSAWVAAGLIGLMGLLFADAAASIAWSWAPDASWVGAAQMLAYLAVFAGAIMLARPLHRGWPILLGALCLWSAALCGWSLLVKVFPTTLAAGNQFGRLQAPFGYWNAIALCAAMGVPCCMWLGARRDGGRRLAALAAPALTLIISVLVLSYSRSADLAAAVAAGLWLIAVPLRLRALALLAIGAAGAGAISGWFFAHHGLVGNRVALRVQDHAGHGFGLVLVVVLVLVTVLGVAATEAMDRSTIAPETRRRIGTGVVGLLIAGVAAAVLGVATSSRGLTGQISYHWHELVNPAATVSAGSASRVFSFGSSRPAYWHEALAVGHLAYWKGVGELGFSIARLLDPLSTDAVFEAHSYVFQTYADLGTLGLVLSAALLAAWLAATGRTLSLRARWEDLHAAADGERVALVTLAVLVVGFGVQGTLDWTWFITGVSAPALLAAGWVAGRGSRGVDPAGSRPARSPLDRPLALLACVGLVAAVLVGGWLTWRPLHSAQLVGSVDSLAQARAAQRADPFSLLPYDAVATFQLDAHQPAAAVATLEQGTREQPHNPQSWEQLAELQEQLKNWPAVLAAAEKARTLVAPPVPLQFTALGLAQVAQAKLNAQAAKPVTGRHSRTTSAARSGHSRHR